MPEESKPTNQSGLIIQPSTGLVSVPDGESSAMSEIINHPLVHIQTSKSLAVPVHRAGEEQECEIAPGVKIVMCWIPPGEFLMGSPEDELGRRKNETQHRVTITQGFWLGKYPVTQTQWEAVMGSNPSEFKGPTLPVESVSCNDISGPGGFIEKLDRYTAEEGIFCLPTEAQWEYACRAGTTTALNNGKNLTSSVLDCPNLDEVAWYGENSKGTTHPVGQKQANKWGLHDMQGNVPEWCADWYADYTNESLVDPQGQDAGRSRAYRDGGWECDAGWNRACRGGAWVGNAGRCRVASRSFIIPGSNSNFGMGFRLARSSAPSTAGLGANGTV